MEHRIFRNKALISYKLNTNYIWDANQDLRPLSFNEYFRIYKNRNTNQIGFFCLYEPKSKLIDLAEARLFLRFLHSIPINKKGENALPIILDLNGKKFTDKLIYIIFETIIYHITIHLNWSISVIGKTIPENCSNGICCSSLVYGNWPLQSIAGKKFVDQLADANIDRGNHYKYNRNEQHDFSSTRYLVHPNNTADNSCSISSDILEFLSGSKALSNKQQNFINCIAKAIIEIKDNCAEHTCSPYLYDIDIKEVTHGINSTMYGQTYIAINIAIWDFSGVRLGDAIKTKIKQIQKYEPTDKEYLELVGKKEKVFQYLMQAEKKHSTYWGIDEYDENDFYALVAFQPGVTGRICPGCTGGAGLSHVLDFLLDYPDNYRCYCLTGDSIITLDKKYLSKNTNNWYSFNDGLNANFLENRPSKHCVYKSKLYYPGTAFFLHLELNGE